MGFKTKKKPVDVRNFQIVHQETYLAKLSCDTNSPSGFGIGLSSGVFATDFMGGPKLIDAIDENSPAEECGTIQIGDRILSINDVPLDDASIEEAMGMLSDCARRGRVNLEIEFDVAESVVPTSGTFALKEAFKLMRIVVKKLKNKFIFKTVDY